MGGFAYDHKNNETMQKAANSLYQLNSDAVARQCAQSRADATYWETIKNNVSA